MAKVPTYGGNSIERAPVTNARFRAADAGGGVAAAVAHGLQKLGASTGDFVQTLAKVKEEQAVTEAKEADIHLASGAQKELEDPETGFRYTRGKNAVDGMEGVRKRIARLRSEAESKLSTPFAKEMFKSVADRRMLSIDEAISRHVAVERESWMDEVSLGRIALAASDAGNAYDDQATAEKHIATIVSEIGALSQRKGWSPEEQAAKTQEAVSNARLDVARRISPINPDVAEKYLDTWRSQIASDHATLIEDDIRKERAAIVAEQRRVEREARQEAREQAALLGEQARDTISLMERGNVVDAKSVEQLATQLDTAGKPILAAQLRSTAAVQTFRSEARDWRPDQLQGWLNDARARTKNGASIAEAAQIGEAEKLLGEMKEGLKSDPLSWAVEAGVTSLPPVDLNKPATVKARITTALAVAERYGTKPVFLTDEEAAAWTGQIERSNADQKGKIAGAIVSGFGRYSRDVLASISNSDPVFAHAAALRSMGGRYAVTARRIFSGQEALASKAVALPSADKFADATADFGKAMAFTPKTRGAVIESAKAIYASVALQGGFDPKELNGNVFAIAMNRAAGATYRQDGSRIGGFATYRGVDLVLPINVSPDEFPDLLGKLNDADLKAHGALPKYADGKPVAAADIRRAYLFDAGSGRYFVSLDKYGTQFLRGPHGHFILNVGALAPRLRGR